MRLFDYFHPWNKIARQRGKYLNQQVLPRQLSDLLSSPSLPLSMPVDQIEYIVLDFETTGFDCDEDLILSIGWVLVKNGNVDLTTSQHIYISSVSQIKPETAVINHITPQMLSTGIHVNDAMSKFFHAAKNKVIVAHGCVIETNFVNKYLSRSLRIPPPPLLWIDTLQIEKRLERTLGAEQDIDLTLSGTRRRYALPEYNTHNALVDAVSTAELLLAQKHRITPNGTTTIGTLFRLSV